jgi:rhamnosyltransferase subunit B
MRPDKIVLATFGTHGDLHPFIAVALGLRERGFNPVVATYSNYRDNVQAAGLAFHPLRPSMDQIESDLNMSRSAMLRAARKNPEIILTKFFLPYLRQSYEDALAVISDAKLVFTNSVAFGPKLAAEKLRLPHIGVVLQPYTLISAFDPPIVSNAERLSRLAYRGGIHSTRAFLQLAKFVSKKWARPIRQFRRQIGLPATSLNPFFEGQFTGARALGLYSHLLGEVQPDFPPGFVIGGFAYYDGAENATVPELKLSSFLERGPPPLVFTLGTSAVHDSAQFVEVACDAVRELAERAVIVLDEPSAPGAVDQTREDILITGYVPYSRVFARAKVIIHHGGIGTTAQALKSGRPQLIAPYFVDQPDNAARVERLGVARIISHHRWTTNRVTRELRTLISNQNFSARAEAVARELAKEDAVAVAVRVVTETLTAGS